jgi:hypothetical protein
MNQEPSSELVLFGTLLQLFSPTFSNFHKVGQVRFGLYKNTQPVLGQLAMLS